MFSNPVVTAPLPAMSSAFILPFQTSTYHLQLPNGKDPRRHSVHSVRQVTISAQNRPNLPPVPSPLSSTDPSSQKPPQSPSPRIIRINRIILSIAYVSFVIYAAAFAPRDWHSSYELQKLLDLDFGRSNDAFIALVGLSLVTTSNYIGALNAGAPRQTIPSTPFTILATFFGFFAIGPYLIFRKYASKVSQEEFSTQPRSIQVIENSWFFIPFVVVSLGVYAYAFGSFEPGGEIIHDLLFYSSLENLLRISKTDAFVNIVCVDFVIRTFLLWGPLTEDMRRRGWFSSDNRGVSIITALIILCTPGLGPSLYLSTKSELPTKDEKTNSPRR